MGNSSTTGIKITDAYEKEYLEKLELRYLDWIKTSEEDRELSFIFISMAVKKGDL